jgi:osmoprotectant transport system substrate-binding protein
MGRMVEGRTSLYAACFALAVLGAACTNPDNRGSHAQVQSAGRAGAAIMVGLFGFPKSVLLACIYAGALAARGFPVRVLPDLGTRELVNRALMNGLIQLVPEYAGSALEFMSRRRRAQALLRGGREVP